MVDSVHPRGRGEH